MKNLLLLLFFTSGGLWDCAAQTQGDIDLSFGTNGIATVSNDYANPVFSVGPNDDLFVSILVNRGSGNKIQLSHLDEDGLPIASFGNNGQVELSPPALHSYILIYSSFATVDSSLFVCGTYYGGPQNLSKIFITKLQANGIPDPSFGNNGTTHYAQNGWVARVIGKSNGKIVVGGSVNGNYLLLQFLPDGSIDSTFGQNGVVTSSGNGDLYTALDMAIQADGKILIAGEWVIYGGGWVQGHVKRLNADGSLDNSFNQFYYGAQSVTSGTSFSHIRALINGDILVGGQISGGGLDTTVVTFLRLKEDGTLDTTYGSNGIPEFHLDAITLTDVCSDTDGKGYSLGHKDRNPNDFHFLGKFSSIGKADSSFGNQGFNIHGIAHHPFSAAPINRRFYLKVLEIQSSGNLVACGFTDSTVILMRFHNDLPSVHLLDHRADSPPRFSVFPNPVASGNILNASISGRPPSRSSFGLYNLDGALIHAWIAPPHSNGQYKLEVPADVSPGIYFLQMRGRRQVVGRRVMVK